MLPLAVIIFIACVAFAAMLPPVSARRECNSKCKCEEAEARAKAYAWAKAQDVDIIDTFKFGIRKALALLHSNGSAKKVVRSVFDQVINDVFDVDAEVEAKDDDITNSFKLGIHKARILLPVDVPAEEAKATIGSIFDQALEGCTIAAPEQKSANRVSINDLLDAIE